VPKKQSDACATCPRNAWGTAPNGGKGKACGDHRRLAIVPLTDLRNEAFGGPLLLRCPAASLQDMAAFDSRYKGMGYPYFTMGVKIGFDAQESFPKFTFAAIRPLTEEEGRVIMELRNSPETARVINEMSGPAPAQIAAPAQQAAFLEAPPANAIQPQQVSVRPAPAPAQPAAAAQPQPAPAPAPAPAPVPARQSGTAGGFGPVAGGASAQPAPAPAVVSVPTGGFGPAAAQPVAAQPAGQPAPAANGAAKPAVQMTGFGGAAPEVTAPAPAQPAPAVAPTVTDPGVVNDFSASIDDRLNALLGN
jgi:hypothetical protein